MAGDKRKRTPESYGDIGAEMTPERRLRVRQWAWEKYVQWFGLAVAVEKFPHLRPVKPVDDRPKCRHPRGVVCALCYADFPEDRTSVALGSAHNALCRYVDLIRRRVEELEKRTTNSQETVNG